MVFYTLTPDVAESCACRFPVASTVAVCLNEETTPAANAVIHISFLCVAIFLTVLFFLRTNAAIDYIVIKGARGWFCT